MTLSRVQYVFILNEFVLLCLFGQKEAIRKKNLSLRRDVECIFNGLLQIN